MECPPSRAGAASSRSALAAAEVQRPIQKAHTAVSRSPHRGPTIWSQHMNSYNSFANTHTFYLIVNLSNTCSRPVSISSAGGSCRVVHLPPVPPTAGGQPVETRGRVLAYGPITIVCSPPLAAMFCEDSFRPGRVPGRVRSRAVLQQTARGSRSLRAWRTK